MSGPFKMKGSSFYGHGNQKRENGMPYASPAKQTTTDDKSEKRIMSLSEDKVEQT